MMCKSLEYLSLVYSCCCCGHHCHRGFCHCHCFRLRQRLCLHDHGHPHHYCHHYHHTLSLAYLKMQNSKNDQSSKTDCAAMIKTWVWTICRSPKCSQFQTVFLIIQWKLKSNSFIMNIRLMVVVMINFVPTC